MTTKSLRLSLLVAALLAGCTKAPSPAASAPVDTAPPAAAVAPAPETEEATQAIPNTADGIWQAIDQKSAELKASIASGSLANVHHQAFAIRDLVAALPAHSPSLSPVEQSKLQSEVKFVATLADRLDQSGDSGDRAGAQSDYDKLVAVLNGITRYK
jgi:hypothetical protein